MKNEMVKARLPGFTISEIIISLIMSAILIGLVVKLYEYLSEIHRANDENLLNYEAVLNFEHLLFKSMEESDSVCFFPGIELKFYKKDQETSFSFSDSIVVYRDSELTDTFFIKIAEINGVYHPIEPSLLLSLSFHVMNSGNVIALELIKEYDGETIVKSQLRNNEN